jgi:5-bromo-4-chloroindolyl phosphate hydrolysis protein
MSLMNFNEKYQQYLKKLVDKSAEICKKLNEKALTLSEQKYKELYNDMVRVIQGGLTTK